MDHVTTGVPGGLGHSGPAPASPGIAATVGADPSLPRRREQILDVCVALVLLLPTIVGVVTGGDEPGRAAHFPVLASLLGGAATIGLIWRRQRPVAVLVGVIAAAVAVEAGLHGPSWFMQPQIVIALYTVSLHRSWRQALTIAGSSALVLVVADSIARGWSLGDSISRVALAGAALAYGLYIGTRRAYIVALRETAMRLERERSLLAQQAVADERVRIARELHDIIAHHVTLLVVQAGAVRETLPADHRARPMLDSMASTGRQALDEMRRMLGLLRTQHGRPAMAPLPGLAEVDGLIEQARATGLLVEMRVAGEPRALPVGVDLSAYRIVQEALTNVIKHGGRARVEVTLRYGADALELDVTDDGHVTTAAGVAGGGHGLVGMRERVALFGGDLEAGPRAGGGYAVHARLPVDGRSS